LLLEATLTAVVIGVGLVAISRALSSSLHTLSRMEEYDRMLSLAETTLQAREVDAQQFGIPPSSEGPFEEPDHAYRWRLTIATAEPGHDGGLGDAVRAVTLQIARVDGHPPLVQLTTLWPSSWVASQ